jgi:spore germination cell wall hydrolase CwlJ-like protein
MKTLCSIMATLSCMLMAWLIGSALFELFYLKPHVQIPLPIPAAARMVHDDIHEQTDCLAQNIYFEGQGETAKGKLFIGAVVMERTRSPHFPSTICGVVYEPGHDQYGNIVKNTCQFSWTCDGNDHTIHIDNPIERKAWEQSYLIATLIIAGKLKPSIDMNGVTNYHARYVNPIWAHSKNFTLIAQVGNHLFYRWKKAFIPNNQVAMN